MSRQSTLGEIEALARLTREFDTIKRQFHNDDRALATASSTPVMPASRSADEAIGDWDHLFDAVTSRLRQIAGASAAGGASVQTGVLECAAALDQLHAMMRHGLGRRRQLVLEDFLVSSIVAPDRAGRAGAAAGRPGQLPDGLTSRPHRSLFRQRLDHLLGPVASQSPSMALLCLDLDGFQPISDTYGLDAGDELLRIVAERLVRTVGAQDIVSYLGADEFACLRADSLDRQQVSQLACQLFDAVSAPLTLGKVALSVRPSIGIAMCPDDGSTSEVLLERADAAMVRAKRQQTGYAFFDQRADR
jgi:diguanylate cyclase